MDITPLIPKGVNYINGYTENALRINDKLVSTDVIITPNLLQEWNNNDGIFAQNSYEQFFEFAAEHKIQNIILLIGVGKTYIKPDISFVKLFAKYGIMPEVMNTASACKTYNVLVSEQRLVCAMLSCNIK